MKLKHLLLATTLVSASASAQITIQGSALNGWAPADTVIDLTNVNASATPNGNWDLTTATYGANAFGTTDHPGTHPSFPQATFRTDISYGLNFIGYISTLYRGKDNNGVYGYGEQMERQAYSLEALTMNNQDSLIFLQQTIQYSTPEKEMAFPMTMGTNWGSTIHYNTDFELTIAMYGLTNAPGQRRTTAVLRDTVKGWGKMRVKDKNGNPSAYMDVLAVQEREYATDSFYLAGSPAPDPLLTAFGLTQGQVGTKFTTKFYRSGEVNPLLWLNHTDSTFTTTTGTIAMVSRLEYPITSVSNVSSHEQVTAYPNPVTDGMLHLDGIKNGSNWRYTLTALNGQTFNSGSLQAGNATINVREAAAGVYTLTLFKDGVSQGGQFVIIR